LYTSTTVVPKLGVVTPKGVAKCLLGGRRLVWSCNNFWGNFNLLERRM